MTTFVHCRGCGHQIHETAATCPKCGAPQQLSGAPSALASTSQVPATYGEVPWFRRRWFLILSLLLVSPAAAVIAWTGQVYYLAGGTVKPFPPNTKIYLTCLAAGVVLAMGSDDEMLAGFTGICVLLAALAMSLRK